jgi:4-hydroxy-4-methyl-2-oxoglutarate aldolase
VVCAGALVAPGDAIVCDDAGVVVVPRGKAVRVAEERIAREERMRAAIRAGEATLDLLDRRAALADKGLRYVDRK